MPPSFRLLMASLAGSLLCLSITPAANARTALRDLTYGPQARNQLDLFLPEQPEGAPVVVYIHGGRWLRGDKNQVLEYDRVEALNRAGIAVASINHTYSTEAPWPAQLADALAAIGWLEENAAAHGLDASRLGLWGQSSGGHIVLMTAAALASEDKQSLKAVVAWFPPSDLFRIAADRLDDDVPDRGDGGTEPLPESLLIAAPVSENRGAADRASPVAVLAGLDKTIALPPIRLVHGTQDAVISPLQTQRLMAVLASREGQDVSLRQVEGGGHGGTGFAAETAPSVEFLAALLKPAEQD